MSYLTETKRRLELPSLTYEEDIATLHVGEASYRISQDLVGVSPWLLVDGDSPNHLEEAAVCATIDGKLIGTPLFHKWVGANVIDPEITHSVVGVMRTVFTELEPEVEIPDVGKPNSFGFGMEVNSSNHPHLYTAGFCACLGPNPEGLWVGYQEWDEGFCQYDWHNIDADSQAWSLLAGMGHLALLAAKSV